MDYVLYAADSVYTLLFLVAGVLAAFQSQRDLWITRNLVIIGASIVAVRWSVWTLTTEAPWLVRGVVGALIGSTLFVLLPGVLHWLSERQADSARTASNDRWTWAALTPTEIDDLYSKLRKAPRASVDIACNRAECAALADSFDHLFRRLGWPSAIVDGGILAVGVTGIYVGPSDETASILKQAIETTTTLRPDLGNQREKGTTHPIMLIIGTKPANTPFDPLTPAPSITPPLPTIAAGQPLPASPPNQASATTAPPSATEPKIAWQFPRATDARNTVGSLFGTGSGTAGFFVVRYRISGVNHSGQQLTNVDSYVIPKNTGEKIQMQFETGPNEWRDTKNTYGIPPEARFTLAARIYGSYRDEKVATAEEYLDKYGGFTFVFNCAELPSFSHAFDYADLREMLLAEKARVDEQNKPAPTIQPKE